jgi:uncharacterized protein YqeY
LSLLTDIKNDLKQAMLDKNHDVRDTIRMFLAELQRYEIDNKVEADDALAINIINKMIKQRNDSITQFMDGGREDLAKQEGLELKILSAYKPEQLSEDKVKSYVDDAINDLNANSMQDMGKVMGLLKPKLAGKADMGLVSKIVKDSLSS